MGCQGRLDLVVSNNTDVEIRVVSDGKTYFIPPGGKIRFGAPSDHSLFLKSEGMAYQFNSPFNRRPHTLNDYIDIHLITRIQINASDKITILPVDKTNQSKPPISVKGQFVVPSPHQVKGHESLESTSK